MVQRERPALACHHALFSGSQAEHVGGDDLVGSGSSIEAGGDARLFRPIEENDCSGMFGENRY